MKLRDVFRVFFGNRRREQLPVPANRRRGWNAHRDAERKLKAALNDFEDQVTRRDVSKREVANDIQQVVLWHTFYPGCSFNKSGDAAIRLCTNPQHAEARNDAPAYCDEESCPIMRGLSAA